MKCGVWDTHLIRLLVQKLTWGEGEKHPAQINGNLDTSGLFGEVWIMITLN